jgi:hypothetical protein
MPVSASTLISEAQDDMATEIGKPHVLWHEDDPANSVAFAPGEAVGRLEHFVDRCRPCEVDRRLGQTDGRDTQLMEMIGEFPHATFSPSA